MIIHVFAAVAEPLSEIPLHKPIKANQTIKVYQIIKVHIIIIKVHITKTTLMRKINTIMHITQTRPETCYTPLTESFRMADDILRQGVQGISDLISRPGLISLDFADIKTIMKDTGFAHMGIGRASGETRAEEAAKKAIHSPLLETTIEGAKGVILNVTGGADLGILEVKTAAELVEEAADKDANIIIGAIVDENMG